MWSKTEESNGIPADIGIIVEYCGIPTQNGLCLIITVLMKLIILSIKQYILHCAYKNKTIDIHIFQLKFKRMYTESVAVQELNEQTINKSEK